MGNIPIYISKRSDTPGAPDSYSGVRASGDDFGAGIGRAMERGAGRIGAAVNEFGNTLSQAGDDWEAVAKEKRANEAASAVAQADFTPTQNQILLDAPAGGKGVHDTMLSAYDKWVDDQANKVEDPKASFAVRQQLMARRPAVGMDAANYEFKSAGDKAVLDMNGGLATVQNKVRLDASKYDEAKNDGYNVIDTMQGVGADDKARFKVAFTSNLSKGRFEGLVEKAKTPEEIAALQEQLGTPEWQSRFTPEGFDQTKDALDTALTKMRTATDSRLGALLSDFEARNTGGKDGIIPQAELDAVYPLIKTATPEQQARFFKVVGQQKVYWNEGGGQLTTQQLQDRKDGAINNEMNKTGATNFLLGRLNKGKPSYYVTNMQPALQTRLAQFINAAPPGVKEHITIVSGTRSLTDQARLYAASGGSGMVGSAKGSQHPKGAAADLGWKGGGLRSAPPEVKAWMQANAAKYGLKFPLLHMRNGKSEPWHIELMETRGGAPFAGGGVAAGAVNAPANLRPIFEATGARYGLPPAVLAAMGRKESGFRPGLTSPKGAKGIMQFMPDAAARFNVNVGSPESSIDGAGKYMHFLLKRYNGDMQLALAGYNWGEGNVDEWIKNGSNPDAMPAETRDYVAKIMEWSGDGSALEMSSQHGVSSATFYANQARDKVIAAQQQAYSKDGDMMTYSAGLGKSPPSLDNPEAYVSRGQAAQLLAEQNNIPLSDATPLTKSEVAERQNIIQTGSAEQVMQLMGDLKGLGPDMSKAAFRQLGETSPVFAYAAGLREEDDAAASAIIKGQKRIDADKTVLKEVGADDAAGTWTTSMRTALGQGFSDLAPDQLAAAKQAVQAHYVQSMATSGGLGQGFNQDVFDKSVQAVFGNRVGEVNGATTLLPPGVDEEHMNNALDKMTTADWAAMSVGKMPPIYAGGDVVPAADLAADAHLYPLDGGQHYKVRFSDGSTVMSRNGPYVFTPDPARIIAIANGANDPVAPPPNFTGAEGAVSPPADMAGGGAAEGATQDTSRVGLGSAIVDPPPDVAGYGGAARTQRPLPAPPNVAWGGRAEIATQDTDRIGLTGVVDNDPKNVDFNSDKPPPGLDEAFANYWPHASAAMRRMIWTSYGPDGELTKALKK